MFANNPSTARLTSQPPHKKNGQKLEETKKPKKTRENQEKKTKKNNCQRILVKHPNFLKSLEFMFFFVFFGFLEVFWFFLVFSMFFLVFSISLGLSILLPGLFSHWLCVWEFVMERVYTKSGPKVKHLGIPKFVSNSSSILPVPTSSWFFSLLFCCMHMVWTEHVSFQKDEHRLHCPARLLCCASGPGTTWWSDGGWVSSHWCWRHSSWTSWMFVHKLRCWYLSAGDPALQLHLTEKMQAFNGTRLWKMAGSLGRPISKTILFCLVLRSKQHLVSWNSASNQIFTSNLPPKKV